MQYHHFPDRPEKLDAAFVEAEYAKLTGVVASAEAADTPDAWIELFDKWNDLTAYIGGEGSRRSYLLSKDMTDEAANEADREFREEIRPKAEAGESKLVESLLASRHKIAVGERFGPQLLCMLETQVEPLAPINSDLRVKCSDVTHEYDKLLSGGEVRVRGETLTLQQARGKHSSEDPDIRKEAFFAHRRWFQDHRDQLAKMFDDLVHYRDEMGRNLGHDSFTPLGYESMNRTDYGPEDAKAFRDSIREFAAPVLARIHGEQARTLGESVLSPWNMTYHPERTLPSGIAKPVDRQIAKAQAVFDDLAPWLGKHFARMRDENLIDLENRKGKRAGAFCTSFDDEKRVAIMCNSVGDMDDVSTLMHEMGHAFQGWESTPIEAVELRWPTADACEIHSMGMEYLSQRHIGHFFAEADAHKYIASRWAQGVRLLCYISTVDEFQHWIYAHPKATADERDATWVEIFDRYHPGIDWSACEDLSAMRWYAQLHIFDYPFYYIDYGIAETGAMQLALMDRDDHDKAMLTYRELCRTGGTKSVLGIFESAGMRSPFDPALMRDLMSYAAERIGV